MARIDRSVAVTIALALLAAGTAVGALFALPTSESPLTYRAESGAAALIGAAAGGLLIAAAAALGRHTPSGLLLALAALWFAQDLPALGDSAALLRSVATAAACLTAAVVLHLALGRLTRLTRAGYLVAAVIALATATLRDPFRDVYCWRQCSSNPLLIHPASQVVRVAGLVAALAFGYLSIAVVVRRLHAATQVRRAQLAPLLIGVALVAAGEAARATALLTVPLEDPRRPGFIAIYLLRAAALAALAAGVLWTVARARLARARVRRLAAELGAAPAPVQLRAALAEALGDPSAEVLYWVPAIDAFVNVDGAVREEPAGPVTRITRAGRLLALVSHDTGTEIEPLIGPAARLAIENSALRAEVLAQLEQLRESRARIVATADDSRRRLERDLHDGAQQRLLSVLLELRLARSSAPPALAEELGQIGAEVDRAFSEMRDLAHGIYPAVLTEAGLEAALPTLADVAELAVDLRDVTDLRLPAPVEAGAYVTVDEAIRDAAARHATAINVSAAVHDGRLVITAEDDGTPRATLLVHVADRVGALGGVLELEPTLLRAEIPCA
jgi:signal transduction histidine kinase